MNYAGEETAGIEVLNAEDRSLIGTIILEHAYDLSVPETTYGNALVPNVKQGEGISYLYTPDTGGSAYSVKEFLAADGIKVELLENKREVTGHERCDIVDITGDYNRLNTYGGDDVITITGNGNRVAGGGGKDIYKVDLNAADNTVIDLSYPTANGVIHYTDADNPDRIVILNANSSDILFSYDEENNTMELVNAAGNILKIKYWAQNTGCVVAFADGELSQAEITNIAGNTKKIYEVNGEGQYSVPCNYTGIAFKGYGWTATIPKYRASIEYDLSQYSNYITRYIVDYLGEETAGIEVLNAEDRSLIGTIIIEQAYDRDITETTYANYLTPFIKQGEGISYFETTSTGAGSLVKENLAAIGVPVKLPEDYEEVIGHQGSDIIEITGEYNNVNTYGGSDVITITGSNNRVYGGAGKDIYIVDLAVTNNTVINQHVHEIGRMDSETNTVLLQNMKSTEAQFTFHEGTNTLYITADNGNFLTLEQYNLEYIDNYLLTFTDKTLTVKQAIDIANEQYNDISNQLNISISGYYEVADDVTHIYVDGNADGTGETIRATISNLDESKTIDLTNYQDGDYILSFVTDKAENRVELQVQKVDENGVLGTCVALRFADAAGNQINVGGITYYDSATDEIKTLTQLNFDEDGRYIVNGTDGVDLLNFGGMANVHAGAGDDVIKAYTADNKVIYGEAGNDNIRVYDARNVIVDGGTGDDIITVTGSKNAAIIGGEGIDTISISGAEYVKTAGGEGQDSYVVDFGTTWSAIIDNASNGHDADTLALTNTNLADVDIERFTTTYEGRENVVCVRIQDKNYLDKHIDIMNWDSNPMGTIQFADTTLTAADVEAMAGDLAPQQINGAREVIKSFMNALNHTTQIGFDAMNEAVIACFGGRYSSLEALVEEFKTACMTQSGSTPEEMKAFLMEYCGVNLDDLDTGSIIGSNAGGRTDKTAESIVEEPEGMTPDDLTYSYDDFTVIKAPDWYKNKTYFGEECYSAKVNNINFYWTEERWDNLIEQGVSREVLEKMTSGVINAWAKPAMDLIQNSIGLKLDSEGTTLNRLLNGERSIQLDFEYDPLSTTLAYVKSRGSYYSDTPTVINRTLEVMVINTAYYLDSMSDINGTPSVGGIELDRVIAHELTHGVMAANIVRFESLPLFLIEGAAELVHGVDDSRLNEIMNLVNTDYSGGHFILNDDNEEEYKVLNQQELLDEVFNLEREYSPVDTHTYGGGYLLLRYMAKQCANSMTTDELAALNMPALFSTVLGEEWNSADMNMGVNSSSEYSGSYSASLNADLISFPDTAIAGSGGQITPLFGNDNNKKDMFITGNI